MMSGAHHLPIIILQHVMCCCGSRKKSFHQSNVHQNDKIFICAANLFKMRQTRDATRVFLTCSTRAGRFFSCLHENPGKSRNRITAFFSADPELSGDSRGCEGCSSNNGRCYDNNGDGEGDGCVCSPERSSGVTVSNVNAQLGAKPCQSKHGKFSSNFKA